jgi:hypothetical protein
MHEQAQTGCGSRRFARWTGDALVFALCGGLCLSTTPVRAVVGDEEIFLQGDFIEVGIHAAGSCGTANNAPAGFHPGAGGDGKLGFVADFQKDGWTVGTPPQSADYFLPGVPEEGWTVEWTTGGAEHTFGNYGRMGLFAVLKTSLQETSSGETRSAVWQGEATNGAAEKLRVTQTVRFHKSDLFFVFNVVLTNTGTVPLDSLEYMRNVDPDQESGGLSGGGGPSTRNYVTNAGPRKLVVAKGLNFGITCGLGTIDSRAVVSTEGFSNRDPDAILDSPVAPPKATPRQADEAISVAYRFGTLSPGQSVSIDYAYILNEADLDVALGELSAVSILQPSGTASGKAVIFQAKTDDTPHTRRVEFFVDGVSIGADTSATPSGVFQKSFDSTLYPNGNLNLKVVATFTDGAVIEKTTTVIVDNSGPAIAFTTPVEGAALSGSGIPARIRVLAGSQVPARVSFFRETSATGSVFLGEDLAAPFETTFSVTDLPPNETVIIKAVAADSQSRLTTIQVSGTTASVRGVQTFSSLLADPQGSGGSITVALDARNTFTGRVALDGMRTFSFTGALDSQNHAILNVPGSGMVELQLSAEGAPQIQVVVTTASGSFDGTAVRQSRGRAPSGVYTMLLPPDATRLADAAVPHGTGFGVATVAAAGSFRIVGVLSDGTKFGTGSGVREDSTTPIFAGLYPARAGHLAGAITFDPEVASDFTGALEWLKPAIPAAALYPAAFAVNSEVLGSRFVKPAKQDKLLKLNAAGEVTVAFSEGNLSTAISGLANVPPTGDPVVVRPLRSLSLVRTNGLFSGYFVHSDLTSKAYRGVVLQKGNHGAGYFLGNTQAGAVTLTPASP